MKVSRLDPAIHDTASHVALKGDRIERRDSKMGIRLRGTVYYVDQLQILVKWDDGSSESLRPGVHDYRVIASA